MQTDKDQIEKLIADWHQATAEGDLPRLMTLMAEDVVFLRAGHAPMCRKGFAEEFQKGLKQFHIESGGKIEEIEICGNFAYIRNNLFVTITPLDADPFRYQGYTLTIFRKTPDGRWLLSRDANMLTPAA